VNPIPDPFPQRIRVGKRKVLKEGYPHFLFLLLLTGGGQGVRSSIFLNCHSSPKAIYWKRGSSVRFLKYGIGMLIGAGVGGFIGYLGQCAGST